MLLEQGFSVRKGDERIRTAEPDQRTDYPSIDPELGYRLASFADGEGSFIIARKGYSCTFVVQLRRDDRALIERYRDEVGIGSIYFAHSKPSEGRNNKPKVRWSVQKQADCLRLVHIFDEYQLWSKKAREYEIWRRAVLLRATGNVMMRELEALFHELKAVRAYNEELAA